MSEGNDSVMSIDLAWGLLELLRQGPQIDATPVTEDIFAYEDQTHIALLDWCAGLTPHVTGPAPVRRLALVLLAQFHDDLKSHPLERWEFPPGMTLADQVKRAVASEIARSSSHGLGRN